MGQVQKENWMEERKKEAVEAKRLETEKVRLKPDESTPKTMGENLDEVIEFAGTLAELQETVDALKAHIDNHMDVRHDMVNWGHVGSAKHLLKLLKEASAFAGIKETADE